MSGLACARCLGAGVVITFDGKSGYRCPGCAPPYMKKTAIDLDNLNELRRLEAIDRLVELDMTEGAEYTDEDARLILVMRRKTR